MPPAKSLDEIRNAKLNSQPSDKEEKVIIFLDSDSEDGAAPPAAATAEAKVEPQEQVQPHARSSFGTAADPLEILSSDDDDVDDDSATKKPPATFSLPSQTRKSRTSGEHTVNRTSSATYRATVGTVSTAPVASLSNQASMTKQHKSVSPKTFCAPMEHGKPLAKRTASGKPAVNTTTNDVSSAKQSAISMNAPNRVAAPAANVPNHGRPLAKRTASGKPAVNTTTNDVSSAKQSAISMNAPNRVATPAASVPNQVSASVTKKNSPIARNVPNRVAASAASVPNQVSASVTKKNTKMSLSSCGVPVQQGKPVANRAEKGKLLAKKTASMSLSQNSMSAAKRIAAAAASVSNQTNITKENTKAASANSAIPSVATERGRGKLLAKKTASALSVKPIPAAMGMLNRIAASNVLNQANNPKQYTNISPTSNRNAPHQRKPLENGAGSQKLLARKTASISSPKHSAPAAKRITASAASVSNAANKIKENRKIPPVNRSVPEQGQPVAIGRGGEKLVAIKTASLLSTKPSTVARGVTPDATCTANGDGTTSRDVSTHVAIPRANAVDQPSNIQQIIPLQRNQFANAKNIPSVKEAGERMAIKFEAREQIMAHRPLRSSCGSALEPLEILSSDDDEPATSTCQLPATRHAQRGKPVATGVPSEKPDAKGTTKVLPAKLSGIGEHVRQVAAANRDRPASRNISNHGVFPEARVGNNVPSAQNSASKSASLPTRIWQRSEKPLQLGLPIQPGTANRPVTPQEPTVPVKIESASTRVSGTKMAPQGGDEETKLESHSKGNDHYLEGRRKWRQTHSDEASISSADTGEDEFHAIVLSSDDDVDDVQVIAQPLRNCNSRVGRILQTTARQRIIGRSETPTPTVSRDIKIVNSKCASASRNNDNAVVHKKKRRSAQASNPAPESGLIALGSKDKSSRITKRLKRRKFQSNSNGDDFTESTTILRKPDTSRKMSGSAPTTKEAHEYTDLASHKICSAETGVTVGSDCYSSTDSSSSGITGVNSEADADIDLRFGAMSPSTVPAACKGPEETDDTNKRGLPGSCVESEGSQTKRSMESGFVDNSCTFNLPSSSIHATSTISNKSSLSDCDIEDHNIGNTSCHSGKNRCEEVAVQPVFNASAQVRCTVKEDVEHDGSRIPASASEVSVSCRSFGKIDDYNSSMLEDTEQLDLVLNASSLVGGSVKAGIEHEKDASLLPDANVIEESDEFCMHLIPHLTRTFLDREGRPCKQFTVIEYADPTVIFDLQISIRKSQVSEHAGLGAFLTFRGARSLQGKNLERYNSIFDKRWPYDAITIDNLDATLPDGSGMRVNLTGTHLHGPQNSPYRAATDIPIVGVPFGDKLVELHVSGILLHYEEDEEQPQWNGMGAFGLNSNHDFVLDKERTLECPGNLLLPLGRYGPHSKSDRKQKLHFDLKNFIFDLEPGGWCYGVREKLLGHEQLIDITDDVTGEVNANAQVQTPIYVNEVGHNPTMIQNVKIVDKAENIVEYFGKNIQMAYGETVELLTNYGDHYEEHRERKGYGTKNLRGETKSDNDFASRLARNFSDRAATHLMVESMYPLELFHLLEFITERILPGLRVATCQLLGPSSSSPRSPSARQLVARMRLHSLAAKFLSRLDSFGDAGLRHETYDNADVYKLRIGQFGKKAFAEMKASCFAMTRELQWEQLNRASNLQLSEPALQGAFDNEIVQQVLQLATDFERPMDTNIWCLFARELTMELCRGTFQHLNGNGRINLDSLAQIFVARATASARSLREAVLTRSCAKLEFQPGAEVRQAVTGSFKNLVTLSGGSDLSHSTVLKGAVSALYDLQAYHDLVELGMEPQVNMSRTECKIDEHVVIMKCPFDASELSGIPRKVVLAKEMDIHLMWYLVWQNVYLVHSLYVSLVAGFTKTGRADNPDQEQLDAFLHNLCEKVGVEKALVLAACNKKLRQDLASPTIRVVKQQSGKHRRNGKPKRARAQDHKPRAKKASGQRGGSFARLLFWKVIWVTLTKKLGWRLETGYRPTDYYFMPQGVTRKTKTHRTRVDFFDSFKQVMQTIRFDKRWNELPDVLASLQLHDKCLTYLTTMKMKGESNREKAIDRALDHLKGKVQTDSAEGGFISWVQEQIQNGNACVGGSQKVKP